MYNAPVLRSNHGSLALDDIAISVVLDSLGLPRRIPQTVLLLVRAVLVDARWTSFALRHFGHIVEESRVFFLIFTMMCLVVC